MVTEHDEGYTVFMRWAVQVPQGQQMVCERAVATCYTYDEARKCKRLLPLDSEACVIRFLGDTGGGD